MDRHHRVFFRISLYALAPLPLLASLATGTPGAAFAAGITAATAVVGLAATATPDHNQPAEQPTNNDNPIQ